MRRDSLRRALTQTSQVGVLVGVAQRTAKQAADGYDTSSIATRSLWAASSSFAATIAMSRLGNHLREVRRPSPLARVTGRLVKRGFTSNNTRIHHYLPGIGLAFATGGVALLTHDSRRTPRLAATYGLGVGLTADELRLLAGRSDPYWGGQLFAVAQAVGAGLVSLSLLGMFVIRGRSARRPPSDDATVTWDERIVVPGLTGLDGQPAQTLN